MKSCPQMSLVDETIKASREDVEDRESVSEGGKSSKRDKSKGTKHDYLMVIRTAEKVRELPIYSEWIVCFDTGANVNGFMNPKLLHGIEKNIESEGISGVEGSTFIPEFSATFSAFNMEAKYDKENFRANILSVGFVRDHHYVNYNYELDQYDIVVGDRVYTFERYNGIYVRDFLPERESLHVMLTTVETNEGKYIPREVKSARGIRKLMRIRGLTSTQEMIRMIRSGGLLNCEYTVEDVLSAHKIYGQRVHYQQSEL